jgi:hypothetical protein
MNDMLGAKFDTLFCYLSEKDLIELCVSAQRIVCLLVIHHVEQHVHWKYD